MIKRAQWRASILRELQRGLEEELQKDNPVGGFEVVLGGFKEEGDEVHRERRECGPRRIRSSDWACEEWCPMVREMRSWTCPVR